MPDRWRCEPPECHRNGVANLSSADSVPKNPRSWGFFQVRVIRRCSDRFHVSEPVSSVAPECKGRCVQSSTSLMRASHYTESCV